MKNTTIVVRSTIEFKEKLEIYAETRGLSVSSLVRMLLTEKMRDEL